MLALCAIPLILCAPTQFTKRKGPSGFAWGEEKIRGVNIGGWLLLEPWITPSIFQQFPMSAGIIDEYTLCETLGASRAHDEVLKPHWDSWARFEDFERIAEAGFNLVRIPIGFWAFEDEGREDSPYASGAAPYLEAAVEWARDLGLKVIVDLHGAPGSQNGFDNSGQKVDVPGWRQNDTVERTLRVLQKIQDHYGNPSYDDVIAGVQFLNEPLGPELDLSQIETFNRAAFAQQRKSSASRVVVISDAFYPPSSYNGFLTPSDNDSQNVALDHHEYQVFIPALVALSPSEHLDLVCAQAAVYDGADKWTIIGEWSGAMTDCAAALNGYGIGARYDGTYPGSFYVGSCEDVNFIERWTEQMREDTRRYVQTQIETFEARSEGWIFWNFKTEGSPEWDALLLIEEGLFPQPLGQEGEGMVCSG
ncbi:hypothetical protein MBLNU230_g8261t1 [Neophaeotheca triangularis]